MHTLGSYNDEFLVQRVVADAVDEFYLRQGYVREADFLHRAIAYLLGPQPVEVASSVLLLIQRVPTGLPCATTLANIYLASKYDVHVQRSCNLSFFGRLVDDMLGVIPPEKTDNLFEVLNLWHTSIQVKHSDLMISDTVNHQDLTFTISNQGKLTQIDIS